jgi:hypothetical protein
MESIVNNLNKLLSAELNTYKKNSLELADYLGKRANLGFTRAQFLLYRDNYFFRTYRTVPCISQLAESASLNGDYFTLQRAASNLFEESGANVTGKSHPELLMFSHNTHAAKIFDIGKLNLIDSLSSTHILPETRQFTQTQLALYHSLNHMEVLGANYAQEEAATDMLNLFLSAFFAPYQSFYEEKEYQTLIEYFTCHVDGLEERHADEAKECLLQWCKQKHDVQIAVAAVSRILEAQSNLWLSLKKSLSRLEDTGPILHLNEHYEKIQAD